MTDTPEQEQLIEAARQGRLLEVISASIGNTQTETNCIDSLISLHNQSKINVVDTYAQLKHEFNRDFYPLVQNVFIKVLPKVNVPIKNVMECISHLVREVDEGLPANAMTNLIFPSFIAFCSADPSRITEGLEIAKDNPDLWGDFIPSLILAGAKINMGEYFNEATQLADSKNIKLRSAGCFSLGQIEYNENEKLAVSALAQLDQITSSTTCDVTLSSIVNSLCRIGMINTLLLQSSKLTLQKALPRAGSLTLYVAAEFFASQKNEASQPLMDTIIPFLLKVDTSHLGSIKMIDFGISNLLQSENPQRGISFLESFLNAHGKNISPAVLEQTIIIIANNEKLLSKLLTRWFLAGEYHLCMFIRNIVIDFIEKEKTLPQADLEEFSRENQNHLIFLAHKAVGYLFSKPIICANFIISLMCETQNKETLGYLSDLLFEPLLINYTGKLHQFLKDIVLNEAGLTKTMIQTALERINTYLKNLNSVGNIKELHPSQEQKNMQLKLLNQEVAGEFGKERKKSIFSTAHNITILHGNKAIIYSGQNRQQAPNRIEMPMHQYSVSTEIPRQDCLDPLGLGYLINLFRAERLEES